MQIGKTVINNGLDVLKYFECFAFQLFIILQIFTREIGHFLTK